MRLASTPLTAASACVTCKRDTPTRKAPVMSLKYTSRSSGASRAHCAPSRSAWVSGARPRSGKRCSRIHAASPRA